MQILNIAGYKFVELNDLSSLRDTLREKCLSLALKGTILLSSEGININLAGGITQVLSFQTFLQSEMLFNDISFHKSYSASQPFKRLKIKLKREIITFKQPAVTPLQGRAASISAQTLKHWLDEKRAITLLDTRNDYEIRFGTFDGAVNLQIRDFSELPDNIENMDRDKTIVMFCTGGIRCEKAALYMSSRGFSQVYQLDGGILGYFNQIGGAHYQGECFVFDDRISIDAALNQAGTVQCRNCQAPVTREQQALPTYQPFVSCASCSE